MLQVRGFFGLLFLFAILTLTTQVGAQGSGPVRAVNISAIDASQFPEVTVSVRALNSEGIPVSGLTTADLQVLENGDVMELVRGPVSGDGLVWAHFVIDGGLRMNQADRWIKTRESVRQFAESWMLPDDHVAVSAIEGSKIFPLVEFTRNTADITAVIDSYRPPSCADPEACLSAPLIPLGQILDGLDIAVGSDNQPKFMVFFTGELEKYEQGQASALANKAQSLGIPIYTVLVDGRGAVDQVQTIGNDSGGQSLTYSDAKSVDDFYRVITGKMRPHYEMTYRSPDGIASTRIVQVTADEGRVVGEGSYDVTEIAIPRVTIERPSENASLTPESTQQVVVAKVVFTDDHPRELQSATLKVNGIALEPLTIIPDPTEIQFPFPWESIEASGEVELSVEVKDEFNLVSRPAVLKVRVELPVTAVPTETPVPADITTPGTAGSSAPIVDTGRISLADMLLPISIALLAIVMIVVVLTRDKGPVKAMRQTINKQVDRITKRIVRQSAPRAYLIVLDGDVNVGKSLEIYGTTTVGRSKQDAELLFQQHDETSPISRRHCTIIDEEDHFQIRDEDSANGTYLDGVRLEPMMARELQDGAEIELGRVERGGVKLQFQSLQPAASAYGAADDFHTTRQTRVVKRPQQPGDRF